MIHIALCKDFAHDGMNSNLFTISHLTRCSGGGFWANPLSTNRLLFGLSYAVHTAFLAYPYVKKQIK